MTKFLQNAGSYRHPITLQKQSQTKNDYGEKVPTWTDFAQSRAGIYPISGKDFIASAEVNSEVTTKINLRYIPGVTADMRVKFGERIFKIIAVMNFQERNKEIQLMCKEMI
jgi:SPP1 family predicted phage head-tail adaptor